MPAIRKRGADLAIGDAIDFLSRFYTIDRFEPHPGKETNRIAREGNHGNVRIAYSGGWSITVFDDDIISVLAIR